MIPYKGKVTLEKTIKYIVDNKSYFHKNALGSYDFTGLRFKLSEEEISEILFKFIDKDIDIDEFSRVEYFCECLGTIVGSKDNKGILNEYIDLYLNNSDLFPENEYFDKLFSTFNDKKMVSEFLRYVYSNLNLDVADIADILDHLIDYIIKARQYFTDDRALLSSVISLVDSIEQSDLLFGTVDEIKTMTEKKLIDDKKANGIYDIDQFTLEDLDRKVNEFERIGSQLESLIELTDQQVKIVRQENAKSNEDIANIRIQTLKTLKTEANKILENFNAYRLELLNQEKTSIIHEKDILIADVETYFQKKKMELEHLVSSVGQRIAVELGRIRQQSDYSIGQLQDFVSNNEEVKKMFAVAKEDQAFLNRLAKMDAIDIPQMPIGTVGVSPSTIVAPSVIIPTPERVVEEKINYYFDKNIPFKDRFNELMTKKNEDIEKTGAIYHEKFDDLLTIILNNDVPYMFGPSGCGKTYMIDHQIAKLLGLDVVTNGFIMYETDILGFNNANGIYVPSNFYRCYKYGDIIFLDELDNSHPTSTIVLNSFIGKDEESSYTFPNGDRVKRHPNFRIISAGNTRGNGRSVSHNTRKKLDEAVMQRLTPIEVDYDNRIEAKILENYPDWYNFAINFREAIKQIRIDGSDGPNYNGTITTRDIEAIKRYKDDQSFTDEKIIEYEVIENKDSDYLTQIINEMETLEKNGQFDEGGIKLFEKFKQLSKGRKY